MPGYELHFRLRARPGCATQLETVLLEASQLVQGVDACRFQLVSRNRADDDVVHVTELWTSREEHHAAAKDDRVRAVLAQVDPLLAHPPDVTVLEPAGGKGLSL